MEIKVGVSPSHGAAGHIIQIIDAFDLKGNMAVAFNKGEIAARIGNFFKIDYPAHFQAHYKPPIKWYYRLYLSFSK